MPTQACILSHHYTAQSVEKSKQEPPGIRESSRNFREKIQGKDRDPLQLEIGTFLRPKLAKKGGFHERSQYFTCSADRAAYDIAGPLDAQTQTAISWVSITKDVPVLRIDHVSVKGALLGVWQAAFRRVLDFKEMNRPSVHVLPERTYEVKTIKFVVKLNRGGRAAEYVQRVDPAPIYMTTNPKLALLVSPTSSSEFATATQPTLRNYGDCPGRSTVKWKETPCDEVLVRLHSPSRALEI